MKALDKIPTWGKYKNEFGERLDSKNLEQYINLFCNLLAPMKVDIEQIVYETKSLPSDDIGHQLAAFERHFPLDERLEDFLYFDDRLKEEARKFKLILSDPVKIEILDLEYLIKANEEKHSITKTATIEDEKRTKILKVGDKFKQKKTIQDFQSAWELYTETSGLEAYKSYLKAFNTTHRKPTISVYKNELKKIYSFISECENIDIDLAFKSRDFKNPHHAYLRLNNNYYVTEFEKMRGEVNPTLLFDGGFYRTYGKYVLFRKWLESKLSPNEIKSVRAKNERRIKKSNTEPPEKLSQIFKQKHIQSGEDILMRIDENSQRKISITYAILRKLDVLKFIYPKQYIEHFNRLRSTRHGKEMVSNCTSVYYKLNRDGLKDEEEKELHNKLISIFTQ